ncbi:outer dynein arm-docking complex subunit 3-like [Xenia sp. Carnegie-2017]|uniref:outer dynein arm-docking complex subunit 3-like n=1 Tax=Xenia sp. Carnegie-2017 TaxID=2897299 RepID=UPI001F043444|nr:outer dynein arm-docking complex subunit 3-like [Xenia sp. Carnegie-2017]
MSQKTAVLTEEIEELRKKVALLGGDTKAYKETAQWKIKTNKEVILKMRQQSKEFRTLLAKSNAGDEKVIDEAFKERDPQRYCAMKGLPGRTAIEKLDQQVCESVNRLNAIRHQRKNKQKKLDKLQTEIDEMSRRTEEIQKSDMGESSEAQTLRVLENRLDKMNLKCNEATRITTTYQQIIECLREEQLTWPNMLKDLEEAIEAQREELRELKAMNNDAQIARDTAKSELTRLEQSVFESKREREAALAEYKKQAEEKKEHAEKVEKRLHRGSIQQDDLSDQKPVLSGEEQERKITTYEGAMMKIKDATGVSDIREVVQRFLSQGDTQKHLEQLKNDNEKMLVRLKEEKEKLQREFEDMKYSGEAKLSSGQRLLEEFQQRLLDEEKKLEESRIRQERASKTLINVKAGVEHLADKLQHLKAPKGHVPRAQLAPTSDEYVLDLLGQCEQKLLKIMDDLGGKSLDDILKEDSEFRVSLESKIPQFNTRIQLPKTNISGTNYEDDEDSGDDEDVLSRQAIKMHAQQIIDSKNKKNKPRKNKRKTK